MQRNLGRQMKLVAKPFATALSCCWALLFTAASFAQAQGLGGYEFTRGTAPGAGGVIQQTAATTSKTSKQKRPLPPELYLQPDSTEQLEIIHHRSQLMVTRNPISRIAIANPEIIDVVQYSPKEISVIGLQLGVTTLHIWFEGQANPLIYLVEIIRDPSFEDRLRADFGKLEKQLQILFPNSKVYLIPLQSRLIVKGQAKDEEDAAHILQIVRSAYFGEFGAYGYGGGYANGYGGGAGAGYGNGDNDADDDDDDDDFIVNMLEVPGIHQVMLHVKVAELKRNELRRMGVDIRALIGNYSFGTGSLAVAAATAASNAASGVATGSSAVSAGASGLAGSGGGITGILTKGANTVLFNWLAANHTGKILAAPTVTVLSGHEASFLSGGEFPVQTIVGVGGGATSTAAYRGFGTSVQVQPQVIDRDWVMLQISAEFSEVDQTLASNGNPGLSQRRVETAVKLREGQTIVLAGLFGHTGSTNVARIPFFGELPLIGPTLFNGKVASHGDNELLITVTPELVRPMEPDEVPPYPGFYVTWPNDIELYQYAKTEGYPDQGVYQLSPYGWGTGNGTEIGYRPFNAASFQSPFGSGGGSLGATMPANVGAYGMGPLGAGGYMATPQPSQIYPGPPTMAAPPGGAPTMAPGASMQPSPDPAMSGARQMGGIQQMSYEQPARNGLWKPWGRNSSAPEAGRPNPVNLPTNGTTPSLQNGNDGRLGPNGQRHVAPPRGRY